MTYDQLVFIFAICLCLSLCLCLSWFSLSSPLRREQSDMIYEQGSFVEQAKLMLLFHLERRMKQFNVKGTKLSQWSQSIHMIKMISLVMMLILISLVHGNNVQCFVKMPTTINQDTALLAFTSLGRRGIYTTIYTTIYVLTHEKSLGVL